MAEKRVVIEHRDGREYGIAPADFDKRKIEGDKTYKDLGFKIIKYEDGSEYVPPEDKAAAAKPGGKG